MKKNLLLTQAIEKTMNLFIAGDTESFQVVRTKKNAR